VTGNGTSALVVSWNQLDLLRACIASLRRQSSALREIVVVDNGSIDGSVEWLRAQPGIRLVENARNLGFATANNVGLRICSGDLVLLANADVELAPDYVELCEQHFARLEISSVTGKLLRASPEGVIDSTGHNVYGLGWAENRGEMQPDAPPYDRSEEVFGVCAAAALYRRKALEEVALDGDVFDETYFSYIEDVDVDWRLRWAGWHAWYEPAAVALHHRSASGARYSAATMRHILKNRLLTVVKNYDARSLLRHLPGVIAFTAIKTADFSRVHPSAAAGLIDAMRLLPSARRKRRLIMSSGRAAPSDVSKWLLPFPWRARLRRRLARQ
jgi:GT2 family glycosyltransferase